MIVSEKVPYHLLKRVIHHACGREEATRNKRDLIGYGRIPTGGRGLVMADDASGLDDEAIEVRRDDALRRALSMPPKRKGKTNYRTKKGEKRDDSRKPEPKP